MIYNSLKSIIKNSRFRLLTAINVLILFVISVLFISWANKKQPFAVTEENQVIEIKTAKFLMKIQKQKFQFAFYKTDGTVIADYHPGGGLQIAKKGEPLSISHVQAFRKGKNKVELDVKTESGLLTKVTLFPENGTLKMQIVPQEKDLFDIIIRTKGVGPAYGMADNGAFDYTSKVYAMPRRSPELTGIDLDPIASHRLISNFIIFPKHDFAELNIEPNAKVVRLTEEENVNGSKSVTSMPAMYYFFGSPKEIYKSFLDVRNKEGHTVYKPKYEFFGVGWEAYGALAWKTNQKSVTEDIQKYLDLGFPLRWAVLGSGFWPRGKNEFDEHGQPIFGAKNITEEEQSLQATTSFGLWDKTLYPDPRGMIKNFHDKGLKFMIGLRIAFIPGGPYTSEGIKNKYFLSNNNGDPILYKGGFPVPRVHLLNTYNPEAVAWYVDLCKKWLDYGIDGFKEDLFSFTQTLPDDLIDPVNRALMDKGVYIMGRNNYLGSPADIHRYNDFNFNQVQDRGPINGLAFAYSGAPYVYPDIVGGTGLASGRFGKEVEPKFRKYVMRFAQYAALNPSLSFGYGPWNFDNEVLNVCLEAAKLHDRLHPFIYDAAIKTYESGYPYTMTPMPLAYKDDTNVYMLDDTVRRSYQWMIGESLLATPVFGNDYETAENRNVYLPKGKWIDYDTGKQFVGPLTLDDYHLPVSKTPLFVGGTGFVVEQKENKLKGRIYSVGYKGKIVFNYPHNGEKSTFNIKSANWDVPRIINKKTNQVVDAKYINHAFEFDVEPGVNYVIQ